MSTIQDKIYTYFERNSELKVLSIFNNPFILAEIQDLNWNPGYRFVIFKGDWFTVKYNLDNDWANDKVIIYFNRMNYYLITLLETNFLYIWFTRILILTCY